MRFGINALGMTLHAIPDAELFTALERGVVDGVIDPASAMYGGGMYEALKYAYNPPFMHSSIVTIINLDTWNSIPKHLQDMIVETQIEFENADWPRLFTQLEVDSRQAMAEAGIEFIDFSPRDAEWYVETLYDAEWGAMMKDLEADYPEMIPVAEMFME